MHNNTYPHPILAREGWPFIGASLGATLLVHGLCGGLWAIPLWILFVFIVQFFRDPPRTIPQESNVVLSPADGRIVAIEPVRDPWLERDALKISVFMNVFNVHSNRSPVDATVRQRWYHPGRFVNAALDKASVENERNALHLHTHNGHDITCVQVAGLVARRILCYVEADTQISKGQRYGFIRFGSRVDVYLPPKSQARVTIGDKVAATSTILAALPPGIT